MRSIVVDEQVRCENMRFFRTYLWNKCSVPCAVLVREHLNHCALRQIPNGVVRFQNYGVLLIYIRCGRINNRGMPLCTEDSVRQECEMEQTGSSCALVKGQRQATRHTVLQDLNQSSNRHRRGSMSVSTVKNREGI
jgi:hypothetical protein